jgi:hypothetical protein
MPQTDFSSPIYAESAEEEASSADVQIDPAAQAAAEVDLNDPSLLLQEIDADPNADAYAAPPPPPDGWYRMKLKQIDVKKKDGTKGQYAVMPDMDYSTSPWTQKVDPKSGKKLFYVTTAIEARIQDPGGSFDNIPVFDRFVDSRVQRRTKAVPILTILAALKVKVPTPFNGDVLIKTLLKALAGEPECDVEIAWEGQPSQSDTEAIKAKGLRAPRLQGMHNFPEVGGKRQVTVSKELAGYGPVQLKAQAKVVGYQPVGTKTKKR